MSAVPIPIGDTPSLVRAVKATGLGMASRWRTLSSHAGRVGSWVALVVGLLALTGAAALGDTVRTLAEYDAGNTAGIYALAYVVEWTVDGFGSIAAWVGGFVLVVTLLAPLTAPASPGLIPANDRAGFAFARMSRYTDSLVTHVSSLTTGLQVLALTALASLVTLDGVGRARALLIAWAAWVVTILVAVAIGWTTELVRRASPRAARWSGLTVVAAVGTTLLVDPEHGSTLFGTGPALTVMLRQAPLPAVVAGLVLSAVVAASAGWVACDRTLRLPERSAAGRSVSSRSMSARRGTALWLATWRTLWRTPVVRTPLLLVTVGALGGASMTAMGMYAITAVAVTAPLMLALTWPVNSLALLSGGASWVASLPGAGARVLRVHVAMAWTQHMAVTVLVWVPAMVVHRPDAHLALVVISTGLGVSTLYTAIGAHLSVRSPHPTALEAAQPLLPHGRTIALTLGLLVAVGGPTAWLLMGAQSATGVAVSLGMHLVCAAGATALGVAWLVWTDRTWADGARRARALAGADR